MSLPLALPARRPRADRERKLLTDRRIRLEDRDEFELVGFLHNPFAAHLRTGLREQKPAGARRTTTRMRNTPAHQPPHNRGRASEQLGLAPLPNPSSQNNAGSSRETPSVFTPTYIGTPQVSSSTIRRHRKQIQSLGSDCRGATCQKTAISMQPINDRHTAFGAGKYLQPWSARSQDETRLLRCIRADVRRRCHPPTNAFNGCVGVVDPGEPASTRLQFQCALGSLPRLASKLQSVRSVRHGHVHAVTLG